MGWGLWGKTRFFGLAPLQSFPCSHYLWVSRLPILLGFILTASGLIGLSIFILWETKVTSPLLNIQLFRQNRLFAFSNLAALIHYSATAGVSLLLSLYLQYIKGLTPRTAGLILVAQPILMALFFSLSRPGFGQKLNRDWSPRRVWLYPALVFFTLIFLGENSSPSTIVASLSFLGFGFALFFFSQYECCDGFSGKKVLWFGFVHFSHHATCWPDDEPGNSDDSFFPFLLDPGRLNPQFILLSCGVSAPGLLFFPCFVRLVLPPL